MTSAAQSAVPAPTRRVRLIAAVLVLMLYAAWSVFVVAHDRPLDFWQYYIAAGAMAQKIDVYELPPGDPRWDTLAQTKGVPWYATPYLYPPLTAILVMPLILLTPRAAALIFLLASALALVASALLLSDDSRPGYSSVVALAIAAFFVPNPTTFYAGQVNIFVLLAVALAVWAFRRGRPWLSGVALAIGTMLKVMPITLVAYALWRRQWRLVIVALLALIAITLLGLPIVGPEITWSYIAHGGPLLGVEGVLNPMATNQSLQGLLGRLFTQHSYGQSLADNYELGLAIWYVLVLLIGIATVLVCWPRGPMERFFDLEASLVIVTTFLVSPTAFNHHLVLLVVPFTALAHKVLAGELERWTAPVAALAYVLIDVQGALWHQLAGLGRTELLSLGTYGMMLLWGLFMWLILRSKQGGLGEASSGEVSGMHLDA